MKKIVIVQFLIVVVLGIFLLSLPNQPLKQLLVVNFLSLEKSAFLSAGLTITYPIYVIILAGCLLLNLITINATLAQSQGFYQLIIYRDSHRNYYRRRIRFIGLTCIKQMSLFYLNSLLVSLAFSGLAHTTLSMTQLLFSIFWIIRLSWVVFLMVVLFDFYWQKSKTDSLITAETGILLVMLLGEINLPYVLLTATASLNENVISILFLAGMSLCIWLFTTLKMKGAAKS